MSLLLFYPLNGAYSQVGDDDTAFGGGRSPRFEAFIIGMRLYRLQVRSTIGDQFDQTFFCPLNADTVGRNVFSRFYCGLDFTFVLG